MSVPQAKPRPTKEQWFGLPSSLPAGYETFRRIVPLGTIDMRNRVAGRAKKKPHEYPVAVAIPHLDTLDCLAITIEVLRAQSIKPFIIIVDTGSPPHIREALELMRADDLEIHYIASNGYQHTSEGIALALDVAQLRCPCEYLLHTHVDCFLRQRTALENLVSLCRSNMVVGYRLSPRDWATDEWKWMVGHTLTMLHIPTMHCIGATWSMQRTHHAFHYGWENEGGWPDTETGFNHVLRRGGIKPLFIGEDRNGERQTDDLIDHVRSYAGSRIYNLHYHREASIWMKDAIHEAQQRIKQWGRQ